MKITEKIEKLGKADLHIHSNFSDARPSIEEILDYVQNSTQLNLIAICDHDTIDGALKAKRLIKHKKYRFDVIIGEEISTKEGHILGLFLNEKIVSGRSAHDTILEIKKQGGLAIAAHPLQHVRFKSRSAILMDGIGFVTLLKEKENLDGVETINATPTLSKVNHGARFLNDTLIMKAEVGSSDAHILHAIGKAYTVFEGTTAAELKDALLNCQTKSVSAKWNFTSLMRYLFFFLPKGLRLTFNTLIHGRHKKRPKLINFPKMYKIK